MIIFTEYRATQHWLYDLLAREGFAEIGPDGAPCMLTLYGRMQSEQRETIKAAFQADPDDASVRILLATDAAFEGIDLQNHCSHLIQTETAIYTQHLGSIFLNIAIAVLCRQGNFPAQRGNRRFFLASGEPICRLPSAQSQFRPFPSPQTTDRYE